METVASIEAGAATDIGQHRKANEDSLALPSADLPPQVVVRKGSLYVVADGIGGHQAGKKASDLAAQIVMERYYADPSTDVQQSLIQAIQVANAEIHRLAQNPAYARMGTTIVAAVVRGNSLTVAHVGDSRAYLIGRRGIRLLTRDHTWVAEQVRDGVLTPEQARRHVYSHILTRSLGCEGQLAVEVIQVPLRPGEVVLLCSDGLWEVVDAAEMQAVIQARPPHEAAQQLVDLANQRGGPDNITAIVIRPGRAAVPSGSEKLSTFALSRSRQLVAGAVAGFLLLAGIIGLIALLFFYPLPPVPPIQIAPVSYQVQEGDNPEALKDYFLTTTMPVTLGQPVRIVPGRRSRPFYGKVTAIEQESDALVLTVVNRSERLRARCPLNAVVAEGARPEKGDRVFIARLVDKEEVMVVDTEKPEGWRTWYFYDDGRPVWLYTVFHNYLTPPRNSELAGRQVLLRGRWQRTKATARFDWKEQDLFVLEGEVYVLRREGE